MSLVSHSITRFPRTQFCLPFPRVVPWVHLQLIGIPHIYFWGHLAQYRRGRSWMVKILSDDWLFVFWVLWIVLWVDRFIVVVVRCGEQVVRTAGIVFGSICFWNWSSVIVLLLVAAINHFASSATTSILYYHAQTYTITICPTPTANHAHSQSPTSPDSLVNHPIQALTNIVSE